MSSTANDAALFDGVLQGNTSRVQAALAAGANVNGSGVPSAPIMIATTPNEVNATNFLTEQADRELQSPGFNTSVMPGERALHVAAKRGDVEMVRMLLQRAGADLNATDQSGCTPLLAACTCPHSRLEVVRLLLGAGADPALAEEHGVTPLHLAAQNGHMDVIDMLYRGAPTTLNLYTTNGETPLFLACSNGQESIVSRLLSLGAMREMRPTGSTMCPLAAAAVKGFVGVVRILVNEGMQAVGDTAVTFAQALWVSICSRQAVILRLMLAAYGEEAQSEWANVTIYCRKMLHHGVAFGCPAVVSVLLAAGADEAVRTSEGRIPRDIIGVDHEDGPIDRREEVAIRRMLERGPAYRARSWAWPAEEADGGGCSDSDAVPSLLPAAPKAPVSVQIFRPKDDRKKIFVTLVGRYCEKD